VIRFLKPGPIRGLMHTLATTSLVYIMLLAGAMLVTFELFQPGFGIAGITGALLLAGAGYGLTVLPVGILGLVCVVAGFALLGIDVAVHGLGVPTAAGATLLAYGSLTVFPAPAGALGIPGWLVGVSIASALVFYVPVMTMVRRARVDPQQQRAARSLVGHPGQVRSVLNPEGFVWVADALWRARSEDDQRLRVGEDVVVVSVDGMLLRVRRAVARTGMAN
jgi:membrane-bound serine protease (ClpP class)